MLTKVRDGMQKGQTETKHMRRGGNKGGVVEKLKQKKNIDGRV